MRRLIGQGKIKAAMLFDKYPNEIRVTKPPNGVLETLALVGTALRFRIDS